LFYVDTDGYLTDVEVQAGDGFKSGAPHRTLDRRYFAGELGRTYDVSADCQRFVMLQEEPSASGGTQLRMVLVLNWREELQRLLPVDR
jgi:hypothetical protein